MKLSTLFVLVFVAAGCDNTPDRVSRLEKQVQDLQTRVYKDQSAIDYDLQAKCAKDANAWFIEGWQRGIPATIMLDHTNHYNKALNKCFATVEHHYTTDRKTGTWVGDIALWDVYENAKYANFTANHYVRYQPTVQTIDEVITCECGDKKCKTIEEFNGLIRSYMSN